MSPGTWKEHSNKMYTILLTNNRIEVRSQFILRGAKFHNTKIKTLNCATIIWFFPELYI